MDAKLQLNGLVLLYAYLRRAGDYRSMLGLLGEPTDADEAARLTPMLERVGAAVRDFDPDTGLSADQVAEFDAIVEQTGPLTDAFVPDEDADDHQILAAVAAAVYAEEHVNDGLVHLGDLMDPALAEQFRARTLHFQARTSTVTTWVKTVSGGEPLDAEALQQRDELLDQVLEAAAHIDSDLATIRQFLAS